jgi:Kef-type K+ transport system membrane component KefB
MLHCLRCGSAAIVLLALLPSAAFAATGGHDEILPVLEALVLMLVAGRLGGSLFARFGQSAVLGELAAGVVLGNLGLAGIHALDGLRSLAGLDLLAQIGVIFLLFGVGLESDVGKMVAVGRSALLVAVLGVVAPMVLGYACATWFFPESDPLFRWFIGATLCATSVGITARVLGDLGKTRSKEGRIILGAAVIDDVLGLIVLAVVAGVIGAVNAGSEFRASGVMWIVGKSLIFLVGAVFLGQWASVLAFRFARRLQAEGLLLVVAMAFCFGLSFLAGRVGLAPIVGAFAAGLVLDEVHYRDLRDRDHKKRDVHELLEPLNTIFVPVFFVLMGMRVDLTAFAAPGVLGFAGVLTLAALVGKQVCALGVLEKHTDRLAVGLGMIPRGEVGLIFANFGLTLTLAGRPVVDPHVFSAVVVMVALTTLLTPPLLTWRMRRVSGDP